MDLSEVAERVWYGRGARAAAARLALTPAALLFRAGAAARSALYDAGLLAARPLGVPALGVGNLTVGGTGKTPVAAWACAELRARGARPALLMRGVGGDEAQVHALLNPDVPVVADPDRARGAARAVRGGADCLVLDDAFQHRRAARDVDLVLVSTERFDARGVRSLPAGPYREGLGALSRAAVAMVTRKSASAKAAQAVAQALAPHVPGGAVAVLHLAPDGLRRWTGRGEQAEAAPLDRLRGADVVAPAGVGDPGAFAAQLASVGARAELLRFPDHHAYTADDVTRIAGRATRGCGAAPALVVTTLKDAVKLGPRWPPAAPPLWYVSQRVTVERGAELLAARFDAVAAATNARAAGTPTP